MRSLTIIGLALLFTASTFSFRLSTHRCGGQLVSWSVFGNAEPCAHAKSTAPSCPFHAKEKAPKNCCGDQAQVFEGLVPNTVVSTALEAPLALPSVIAELVDHCITTTSSGHGWTLVAHFRPPPLSGWAIHIRERSILI